MQLLKNMKFVFKNVVKVQKTNFKILKKCNCFNKAYNSINLTVNYMTTKL